MTPDAPAELLEDLVAANRILAMEGVLDAYGHVSVRSPADPRRFLLSRSLAPSLVTAGDILEHGEDCEPVGDSRRPYLERFIHGEIYRQRPDVMAVVHSHSDSVIPFGITKGRLKPVYHMASFLWSGVPVYDIRRTTPDNEDAQDGHDVPKDNKVQLRGHFSHRGRLQNHHFEDVIG